MGAFTKSETIWFNGRLVPWDEARVHVLAHCLHYGTGVFEGIRSYQTEQGPAVFRLREHMERMHASASLYEMQIPYSVDELIAATVDVIRSNGLTQAYIRPIAFFDAHTLDVWPRECPVSVAIAGFPKGAYLGTGVSQGVRVMISSVRRFDNRAIPAQGKSCGQYVNSVRAVQEAQRGGYDEAIFLNQKGDVAEGSGENLFLVRNGSIVTNDASADILMGITRASILELARALGIDVQVAPISVDDLRSADELFFTGTAVEVTPIREVDGNPVADGKPGPVTTRLQQAFFDIVHGRNAAYHHWLTFTGRAVVA
jgi:branched-chain amino acid aminotransferase